ncbi:3-oxoacyl-ACP synthase [Olivibacter sp. XZL3]|uniref:3-oxoacyl-ACP synthase n=1 Tax=Olivibacter sp. XZL3 TaxID=1735116 RepID=UPI001065A6DF|nr:3-oxoacyl-ACP synthase [Olivibacter sp. XZL3]
MEKNLKEERAALYARCREVVEERIRHAEQAIQNAKDAAKDDTKSSAGDKYETTREMMQQEIARNERQLAEANKLKYQLDAVPVPSTNETIQLGSIVETSAGLFFVAIALATVETAAASFFVISPASPVGQLLLGKTVGSDLSFNKRSYRVLAIV